MKALAKMIDHTLLKPQATAEQIDALCEEAIAYGFASVCVNPNRIAQAAERLKGTDITPCCVIGFPLGACTGKVKAFEAACAIEDGAKELDMVISIGHAKEGNWEVVEEEIRQVVEAANGKARVKVILETCLLTQEEIKAACLCAKRAGADFVKTSTGFSAAGATTQAVRLMRETVGQDMGVKAAGGIRTYEDAVAMVEAGADRLGCSAGVEIIKRSKQ